MADQESHNGLGGAAELRAYHESTKHFPGRPSVNPYGLEWSNEPDPFKLYPALASEPLPADLSPLLRLGAGVHPRRHEPRFRTFMSAGALHPVELYVATEAGLFHFHPGEIAFRRLRTEDPRAALADAAAMPELADTAAVLVLTGILWRTAWKYGARGWRHVFWDAGSMLANLLALASEAADAPRALSAFADHQVASLLGVEPPRESPVALLALGGRQPASGSPRLAGIEHRSAPLSRREHRFPDAERAEAASRLAGADDVRAWRQAAPRFAHSVQGGEPPAPLEDVILRRGSARDFTSDPVGRDELSAILAWTCAAVPGDLPRLCEIFAVAHAVDGLPAGVYRFEPPDRFDLIPRRASRRTTAHVCLDQPHGGNAAATLFLTADLDRLLPGLGGRAYRAAQLDAGIRAERTALGCYARDLGATGLTFYDDEVRRYLDTGGDPMICVAIGVDAGRPKLRRRRRARAGH